MRGLRSFIEWGTTSFSCLLRERGERIGCRSVNSLLISQFIFALEEVYLAYYLPTRLEGCINLLNGELQISLILSRERVKGLGVGQPILY